MSPAPYPSAPFPTPSRRAVPAASCATAPARLLQRRGGGTRLCHSTRAQNAEIPERGAAEDGAQPRADGGRGGARRPGPCAWPGKWGCVEGSGRPRSADHRPALTVQWGRAGLGGFPEWCAVPGGPRREEEEGTLLRLRTKGAAGAAGCDGLEACGADGQAAGFSPPFLVSGPCEGCGGGACGRNGGGIRSWGVWCPLEVTVLGLRASVQLWELLSSGW